MSTGPFAPMVCLRPGLRDKSSRPAPPLAGHARVESRRQFRRQSRRQSRRQARAVGQPPRPSSERL